MTPAIRTLSVSFILLFVLAVLLATRNYFFEKEKSEYNKESAEQLFRYGSFKKRTVIENDEFVQLTRLDSSVSGEHAQRYGSFKKRTVLENDEFVQLTRLDSSVSGEHAQRLDSSVSGEHAQRLDSSHSGEHVQSFYMGIHTLNVPATISLFIVVVFCFLWSLYDHLSNWNKANEQLRVVAILLLPNIWAFTSLVAIHSSNSEMLHQVLEGAKESYADLVMCMFFDLLVASLRNSLPNGNVDHFLQRRAIHIKFMQPIQLNARNVRIVRFCIWQSFIIRFCCVFGILALQAKSQFSDLIDWAFSGLFFISGCVAFYLLVAFFQTCVEEISLANPIKKFLCIKMAVSLAYLQAVVFWWWKKYGGLRDYLLLSEMVALALMQMHFYSASPYRYSLHSSPHHEA